MIFNILKEPKGKVYESLLNYAVKYCDKLLLIIRHSY